MADEKRATRLQVMLTQAEIKAVESWRFENRMPSRSAAARALMNLGLASGLSSQTRDAVLRGDLASSDVGVVDAGDDGRHTGEHVLVADSDALAGRGICWLLREAGYHPLGPAASVQEINSFIERMPTPSAVVTEMALGTATVADVADVLGARSIPFIVCTSRPDRSRLPHAIHRIPVVAKPDATNLLPGALSALLHAVPAVSGDRGSPSSR
jgi:hypothetical protein